MNSSTETSILLFGFTKVKKQEYWKDKNINELSHSLSVEEF